MACSTFFLLFIFFLSLDLFLFYIYEAFFFQRRSGLITEGDLVGNRSTLGSPQESRAHPLSRGLELEIYLAPCQQEQATISSHSSALNLVKTHFFERRVFGWPGNLNLAQGRASITCSLFRSLVQMDMVTRPV